MQKRLDLGSKVCRRWYRPSLDIIEQVLRPDYFLEDDDLSQQHRPRSQNQGIVREEPVEDLQSNIGTGYHKDE